MQYAFYVWHTHSLSYNYKNYNKYRVLSHQLKLTAARLKKGTTLLFQLANSTRIFINLCWYYYILLLEYTHWGTYMHIHMRLTQ